jgi:hypothetical protein
MLSLGERHRSLVAAHRPLCGALAWKRQAGSARRTYDLHKLGGVYGVACWRILVASGTMLELAELGQSADRPRLAAVPHAVACKAARSARRASR